ncbi:MAG: type II toxin-antitoxin system prevent-host-death family antitoxin [Oscillospiraceae bacterium]|nr:type II toxin-antitoxin system prevent-host-death family antitoxin [Oscillospiraceae bacterium]
MIETTATATEMKNNFGKYINMVIAGNEVIITKNGKEIGRLIPKSKSISYLTDSLTGILHNDFEEDEREKALKKKYEITD